MLRQTLTKRTTTAYIRPPNFRAIPSTNSNGVVINRDMLMHQFRDFYMTLKQSTLIDKLVIMSERNNFESMKVADQMAPIGPSYVGMPLVGNEHRATEFMETMRYIRNNGGPSTVSSILQDNESIRCHSGDIVSLPNGIAIGHGPRANIAAVHTLQSIYQINDNYSPFEVLMLEQEGDSPPLGDYFGFAGNDVLVAWKDEHGMLAVDQYKQLRGKNNNNNNNNNNDDLQVVYIEQGCHFLSFYGADMSNDIIVTRGFDRSIDSLAGAGLNPIPVQWSEMDKMGISMRASVLILRVLRANTAGILSRNRVRGGRWAAHQLDQ